MGRRYVYGRRKRSKAPLLMFLIMLVAAGAGFIYFSPKFERNPPSITLPDRVFWSKSSGQPISVRLEDDSGLKSYQVTLSDGERDVVVSSGTFTIAKKEALISVDIPEHSSLDTKRDNWTMTVLVNDTSMWNLLRGNSAKKSIEVTVVITVKKIIRWMIMKMKLLLLVIMVPRETVQMLSGLAL